MILQYDIFNTSYGHNKIKIDHFYPLYMMGLANLLQCFKFAQHVDVDDSLLSNTIV
jgi:hypothetical protein